MMFNKVRVLGDHNTFVVPQRERDIREYGMLDKPEEFPTDMTDLGIYIPKLFIKNSKSLYTEYLQLQISYYKNFGIIKKEMITWLK